MISAVDALRPSNFVPTNFVATNFVPTNFVRKPRFQRSSRYVYPVMTE